MTKIQLNSNDASLGQHASSEKNMDSTVKSYLESNLNCLEPSIKMGVYGNISEKNEFAQPDRFIFCRREGRPCWRVFSKGNAYIARKPSDRKITDRLNRCPDRSTLD